VKRNENGVVVPGEYVKLPLRHLGAKGAPAEVVDAMGVTVTPVVYGIDTADFIIHAANHHERFAEIVRRFSEWHDQDDDTIDILPIVTDAATLWKEYQEEPK